VLSDNSDIKMDLGGEMEGRVLDSSVSEYGLPTGSVKCKQFLD